MIHTYIQSEGINQDFGVYDSPDELLKEHHQEMSRVKAFLYRNWGRHIDINKATADFMLEQPWLSLFFYPYKRDCFADYVEQTEYDSDSENIRE